MLVFVGILAAFGLESWWAGRQESERETTYLRGLDTEFTAAAEQVEGLLATHRLRRAQFLELHRLLRTGEGETYPDSVIGLSHFLWTVSVYSPRMPTYESLLGSVGMGVLGSDSLRRALIDYQLAVDANAGWDEYLIAFDQDLMIATLAPRLPYFASIFGDGDAGGPLRPDISDLASDMALRNLIAIRADGERALIEGRQQLWEAVSEVRRLLARELVG